MSTNPYFTQYHTQRFSFIGSPQQRDGTYNKDQRFLNLYPELIKSPISDGKKYYLKKRPGVVSFMNIPNTGTSQGLYYWAVTGAYYAAINGTLYKNTTAILTLASTTNNVGFAEFRTDTATLLFVCDGVKGYTITSGNVITTITDVNFPNPHIPAPIFLDGYIFLAGGNTQTIHNSTLGDPTTWPSDGFIDAEMYPDNIQTLAKAQNYVVAIGTQSCEFLYDNANATGSPLQRNAPAVSQFGTPAPLTVNQTEKEVILVGETGNGGRTIWVIDGFQPSEIANEPVREALDIEGAGIINASAFTIQCAGHKWYVLNLLTNQRTFVYDFEEKMWHEWSTGTGVSAFSWKFATDSGNGTPVLMPYSGGVLGQLNPSVYTDYSAGPINCTVITSKIDFDTIKRKRFYRISLVADAPNGDNNVPILVSWSDDDYNTWSTPVTLNLNGTYPTKTQLGIGRRRAFQFVYQQPYPLRMEAFEVDIIQEVRR
jgi:hypothetical protein